MDTILNQTIFTGIFGFLTGWTGMLIGILFSFFIKRRGKRFKGTVLGFIGGLMLAIVCFDLLPESFEAGSIYIATIEITFGLILAVLLDGRLDHDKMPANAQNHRFLKVAIFMAIGIGALLGGIVSRISPVVICISLAFAGGMILYIIYRETLPSARDTWQGRMSTIGNVIGMIAGMLIVYFLH